MPIINLQVQMESIHRVLKELSENIAPSLAVIFQNSYNTVCCPSVWKQANIKTIYKNDDKKNQKTIALSAEPVLCVK